MPPRTFERAWRDTQGQCRAVDGGSATRVASVILSEQRRAFPPLGRGAETAVA
jgi:hypothetical protein